MKKLWLLGVFFAFAAEPAFASDPTGDWRVEDGSANIRIVKCGESVWGVVGWEQTPGGTDNENPDPTKRSRPTLGMPILLDMKPAPDAKWAGEIYNAKNGKIYKASVRLTPTGGLRVEGCVLGGLFCGGEVWTRVSDVPSPQAAGVCTSIGVVPGPAHKGGLEENSRGQRRNK
jgi:uncharacterized protein (DUF2147 family)